ncbi:hypothetical protein GQ57_38870 [Burkholderia sp. MSh2]|nr:hypothetical protein GQ57_38870 [Burkholderia sp. MSh2]
MQSAHLLDAQEFDWLSVRVVHMRTADERTKRDAHSTRPHIVEQAALRPIVYSRIRFGLPRSEFTGIRTRLAIRVHAHLLHTQRFASFAPRLSTYEGADHLHRRQGHLVR